MSEDQTQEDPGTEVEQKPQIDELAMLKQRARMMGIGFSNNIGVEALREKIQNKMDGKDDELPKQDTLEAPKTLVDPAIPQSPKVKKQSARQQIQNENLRLIRLRITNLDPKKKDLPGEIFTVANSYLGTVRKYVPFGEVTDDGYHVPYCVYKMMKNRKFLNIRTFKDRKNNNQIRVESTWAKEFALEVLPPLTEKELKQLAASQSAAGGLG